MWEQGRYYRDKLSSAPDTGQGSAVTRANDYIKTMPTTRVIMSQGSNKNVTEDRAVGCQWPTSIFVDNLDYRMDDTNLKDALGNILGQLSKCFQLIGKHFKYCHSIYCLREAFNKKKELKIRNISEGGGGSTSFRIFNSLFQTCSKYALNQAQMQRKNCCVGGIAKQNFG